METTIFSITKKRFVNRGFLNGPLCPVYGIGMIVIIYFLEPFYNNVVLLFLLGLSLATFIEYITGLILELLFKTRWWDYSQRKFNLNGYICLNNSIRWGILCVFMIKVIQPLINEFISQFNPLILNGFIGISLIILVIDFIITVGNLMHLKSYIANWHVTQKLAMEKGVIYDKLHNMFLDGHLSVNEYFDLFKDFNDTNLQALIEKIKKKRKMPLRQLRRLYNNYLTVVKKNNNGAKFVKRDLEK